MLHFNHKPVTVKMLSQSNDYRIILIQVRVEIWVNEKLYITFKKKNRNNASSMSQTQRSGLYSCPSQELLCWKVPFCDSGHISSH